MIAFRSLVPPETPRRAFGALLRSEFLLTLRTPLTPIVGLGLPLVLLVIFGTVPVFRTPSPDLGGISPLEMYIPVLLVFIIATLGLLSAPALATYREQGILRRLATTPVPPAWVLGAQLVMNCSLATASMLLFMAVSIAAFGVAAPHNLVGFVLALILTMAAIFALGLCIAAVARGAQAAQTMGGITFAILMFFAGLWLPQAVMPVVLRDISDWTPLGAAVAAIQTALLQGFPPIGSLLILLVYAFAAWWLAVRTFRWE